MPRASRPKWAVCPAAVPRHAKLAVAGAAPVMAEAGVTVAALRMVPAAADLTVAAPQAVAAGVRVMVWGLPPPV